MNRPGRGPRLASKALAHDFDLNRPTTAFLDDPYPTYFALQTYAPVHRLPDGAIFVTRHADVRAACMQTEIFSARRDSWLAARFGDGALAAHYATALMFSDPPGHRRVRAVLDHACAHAALTRALRPALEESLGAMLGDIAGRGAFDAVADFAAHVPAQVAGALFAIPPVRRAPLRGWAIDMLAVLEPACDAAAIVRGERALHECTGFLRELIGDRRRNGHAASGGGADAAPTDALARMIAQVAAGSWSEGELVQNCMLILNAGQDTIANAIGNALHALARFPAERDRLLAEPELIGPAVEEFLRYDGAIQYESRVAAIATTLGGVAIAAGTAVHLCLGAANRDREVFELPDELDVARDPNPHVAFAAGIHHCIGAAIARMAVSVALSGFLLRFPRYELARPPTPALRARYRGFLSLPVRLP